MLKEEKMVVASKVWGSFFRHDRKSEEERNSHEGKLNTFWGSVIRDSCRIAIPLLDYLTGKGEFFLFLEIEIFILLNSFMISKIQLSTSHVI